MNEPRPAREYHRLTEHVPGFPPRHDPRLVAGFQPMVPRRKPPQFKRYHDVEVVPLPADPPESEADAVAVLSGEVAPVAAALDLDRLSNLLFHTAGVVRVVDVPGVGEMFFRAAGSAGNLSPLEVYLVAGGVGGLDDGVYHYDSTAHALDRLGTSPASGAGGAAALVLTGVPWRTSWKYAERGFRHLYWDAGTMLANLLAVAAAAGLAASVQLGFVDADVNRLLGLDGVQEFALAVVPLGPGDSALQPSGPSPPAGFLAHAPIEFPLITETQRAGDLPTPAEVTAWRAAAATSEAAWRPASEHWPSSAGGTRPPAAREPIEAVIRRRGSTRAFDSSVPAPSEALWWAMRASTRPLPGDFVAPGKTVLEHHLGIHAVEGVEPGVYRWTADGLEQRGTGDVRGACAQLCLGQLLGGSGAYTVFHAADLDAVLTRLGSRGYRAAQLEAGVVEGRLHLAAFAVGLGATGLTFFDEEVRRFFRTSSSPILVTAVGRPAYRARPGGRPRRPTRMGS